MRNNVTFKLRLPETELAEWKQSADSANLSLAAWIRERCNDAKTVQGLAANADKGHTIRQPKEAKASMVRPSATEYLENRCPHHKAKGSLCYKCDPKFGNPVIDA